jgi:hypothetical protein
MSFGSDKNIVISQYKPSNLRTRLDKKFVTRIHILDKKITTLHFLIYSEMSYRQQLHYQQLFPSFDIQYI